MSLPDWLGFEEGFTCSVEQAQNLFGWVEIKTEGIRAAEGDTATPLGSDKFIIRDGSLTYSSGTVRPLIEKNTLRYYRFFRHYESPYYCELIGMPSKHATMRPTRPRIPMDKFYSQPLPLP